jgi:hypothetical protein
LRQLLRALPALVVLGAALCTSSFARDVSDAEKAALGERVAAFQAAMAESDYDYMFNAVPPKMFAKLAADNNMSLEQLKGAMIEVMKVTMDTVTIQSFSMDAANARYASIGDQAYALLDTETLMTAAGVRYRAEGDTLALLDDDDWYLVRTNEASQVQMLEAAYPVFADVEFTPGTLEEVKE